MTLSTQIPKQPSFPTANLITSPRQLYAKQQRRDQGKFHRVVVARDHGRCVLCGRSEAELAGTYPDLRMLIADHIVPKMLGGTDDVENGQTLCFFDNLKVGWRSRYKGSGRKGRVEEQGE